MLTYLKMVVATIDTNAYDSEEWTACCYHSVAAFDIVKNYHSSNLKVRFQKM